MDVKAIALGVVFALMWSSAFATARIIVADAPPLLALALRFLLSGAVAVAVAGALGQTPRLSRGQARSVVIFGLCQNAIYLGFNFVALQWIEASLAAIIAAAMPLIVAALGWGLRGDRIAPSGIAGLVLGLAGVGLIMGSRIQGGADPVGVAMCIAGALALAVATLTLRSAASGGNVLMVVGMQMLVGALALGLASALIEDSWAIHLSARLVAAFLYQAFVPGLAATLMWFALVGRIGAVRAATFHFLNPAFGVLVAAVLLHERLGLTDLIGVATVAGGILMVQMARR